MGPAIVGMELQLSVQVCKGLLVLVESKIGNAQVEVHFQVLGIHPQSLLKCIDGLGEFEFGLVDDTEALERFRLVGKLDQGLPVLLLRRTIVAALFELTRLGEKALKGWSQCL